MRNNCRLGGYRFLKVSRFRIAHTGGNRGKEQTPLFEVHPEDCKPDSTGYNSPEV